MNEVILKRPLRSFVQLMTLTLVVTVLLSCQTQKPTNLFASLPITTGDFPRVMEGRNFDFPKDQGPHPEYQTEWWYYTGNLVTADREHFSYQLTFFRRAIVPPKDRTIRQSEWAADQVYLAHFALGRADNKDFKYFQKLERGAAGLAGATISPNYRVWLDDWSIEEITPGKYKLTAAEEGTRIDFDLSDLKGPVLQGRNGYSQKGIDPGNASFYFSQTRLQTTGTIKIDQTTFRVEGLSWMDHEFSTSALSSDQVGWDWFSLQLEDNTEIMLFNIRKEDLSIDKYSGGMIIQEDGSSVPLRSGDFEIIPLRSWKSHHSGAVYPSSWEIRIPGQEVIIYLAPAIEDQELNLSFTYWEGSVRLTGKKFGQPIKGNGFVEMTGYAGSMQGQF